MGSVVCSRLQEGRKAHRRDGRSRYSPTTSSRSGATSEIVESHGLTTTQASSDPQQPLDREPRFPPLHIEVVSDPQVSRPLGCANLVTSDAAKSRRQAAGRLQVRCLTIKVPSTTSLEPRPTQRSDRRDPRMGRSLRRRTIPIVSLPRPDGLPL